MTCSSTNCRPISVMAFCSSVFSEYCGVASAMRFRTSRALRGARRIPALWRAGRYPADDDGRTRRRRGGGGDALGAGRGGGGARGGGGRAGGGRGGGGGG